MEGVLSVPQDTPKGRVPSNGWVMPWAGTPGFREDGLCCAAVTNPDVRGLRQQAFVSHVAFVSTGPWQGTLLTEVIQMTLTKASLHIHPAPRILGSVRGMC